MNQVLTRAHDRLHAIRDDIEKLVTEREGIMTFLKVYSQFAGDEKAGGTPPAGGSTAIPPAPIHETEAPKPLPDDESKLRAAESNDNRPAEAKTLDQDALSSASEGMQDRCESIPSPNSPEQASDAGRFDSGSLTEIVVKPQVQVLPGVDDAKGGPTGMGRSDGGESPAGEGQLGAQALPTISEAGKSTRAKAFVAPAHEHAERTSKRNDVAALHDAEPWLSPDDAAGRLMIPVVNLRIFSSELEIEWSQPKPAPVEDEPTERRKGLQHEVKLLHEEHPEWPAGKIADELRCGVEYVRSAAARLGITLATRKQAARGPVSLRDRVETLRQQHPTWTPRMIATELGANLGSVRTYITEAKREPAAAPVDEAAMRDETIARKRRLGVPV